ncbi:Hypothetical predicted protein [Octopus vulgaris]|uniref:Uncharacterized protein n=1 Tax=Octopus vulgaris TaxID=6645 RepID=A0AA36AVW3_OCTVU|nr:Hypothetical predicted protein [Octopus vulgaris]
MDTRKEWMRIRMVAHILVRLRTLFSTFNNVEVYLTLNLFSLLSPIATSTIHSTRSLDLIRFLGDICRLFSVYFYLSRSDI